MNWKLSLAVINLVGQLANVFWLADKYPELSLLITFISLSISFAAVAAGAVAAAAGAVAAATGAVAVAAAVAAGAVGAVAVAAGAVAVAAVVAAAVAAVAYENEVEVTETYDTEIQCKNCYYEREYQVQIGKPITSLKEKCSNCGLPLFPNKKTKEVKQNGRRTKKLAR